MKILTGLAVAGVLALAPAFALAAGASSGPYVGAQAGVNSTSASDGISSESAFDFGLLGGYDYRLSDHFTLGANLFYEWNAKKTHDAPGVPSAKIGTDVYGADITAGFPVGNDGVWMPFVKLGYGWADFTGGGSAGVSTQNATRYGAGVAWRVYEGIDVNFQYMYQKFGGEVSNWKNQNYTAGFTYYFQ